MTKLIWTLLIITLLFATIPLFKPYVSGTADGLGHRFRLVSFYKSLKEGNIRPRWANDAALGYGAPIFLFNYPLPYYLGSLFLFLGFSVNQSGQILASTSLFLSGFFMFLLGRKLYGNLAGLVAAVVYTYAPYHLQMTYLYDSWGEMTAFIFPPLILYLSIGQNRQARYFVGLITAWFLFILSHNVSVLMFTPVLLLLGFVIGQNEVRLRLGLVGLSAFLLAVILSAFFWLPAAVLQNEMKYPLFLITEGGMRGSFFKSFSFQWETAFRVIKEGSAHFLDFTVGLPILLVGVLGIIECLIQQKLGSAMSFLRTSQTRPDQIGTRGRGHAQKAWPPRVCLIMLLILLFLSLYFTNYLSSWIWNMPPFTYILYPFRFLFVASFAGALLGGLVVKKNWLLAVAIIIFSIVQGRPYLNPYTDIYPFPDTYFYQNQTVTAAPMTMKNMLIKEFLPKYANDDFLVKQEGENSKYKEAFFKNEKGQIRIDYSGAEKLSINFDIEKDDDLVINRFYFPNWEVRVDGQIKKANIDETGRMSVKVSRGNHKLDLVFGVSVIEKIANLISLGGIIIVVISILRWNI